MDRDHRSALSGLAVVVGVACLVYAGCLGNDFVWDDPIVLERQLPFFEGIGSAFFPPAGVPELAPDYYRPVVIASYLVDDAVADALFPSNTARGRRVVFHATPVMAHGIASGLVFLLATMLVRADRADRADHRAAREVRPYGSSGRRVGLVAGLLFAVHPIHVESVAWMAGRSDVLCAVFFFLVPLALLRYREAGAVGWLVAGGGAALGAMLGKEAGAGSLPVAAAVLALAPGRRRIALEAGVFGVAALVYAGLRRAALGAAGEAALGAGPHLERLPGALGWYVLKTVWPWPQSAFVGSVPGAAFAVLGVAVAAGAVAACVWLARRRTGVAERLALALFFGGLVVSLATAVFPIGVTPLAERYLYVPSAGVCVLAALLLARLVHARAHVPAAARVATALIAMALFAYGVATAARVRVWADNLVFWEDTARKAPDDALPRFFLGVAFVESGRPEDAEAQFRAALARNPEPDGRARILNNLGFLLLQAKRYADAAAQFRASLAQNPGQDTAHANLARALLSEDGRRNAEEARGHLEAALALNPRSPATLWQYGQLLYRMGRRAESEAQLRRLVELAPRSREAGLARALLGRLAAGGASP